MGTTTTNEGPNFVSEDPRTRLLESLWHLQIDAMLQRVPASAVALAAIKQTNPELAKRLFYEGYIQPAIEMLGGPTKLKRTETLLEFQDRFWQEDVPELCRALEMFVAEQLLVDTLDSLANRSLAPIVKEGELTEIGRSLFSSVVDSARSSLSTFIVSIEKRMMLLLGEVIAGPEAIEKEIARELSKWRPAYLREVASMLFINGFKEVHLRQAMAYIEKSTDAEVLACFLSLQGYYGMNKEAMEEKLRNLLSIPEDIKF